MKKLTEFIVKSIVDTPKKISVSEEKEGEFIRLIINAPKEEIGRIIGQGGRIIKAIKTILAIPAKNSRFSLEVTEITK